MEEVYFGGLIPQPAKASLAEMCVTFDFKALLDCSLARTTENIGILFTAFCRKKTNNTTTKVVVLFVVGGGVFCRTGKVVPVKWSALLRAARAHHRKPRASSDCRLTQTKKT